jgi:purine-nucleoside phosphorylase
MSEFITIEQIDEAVNAIRAKTKVSPKVGLVLGSGLGGLAESVKNATVLPFKEIPNWPVSTIQGHAGRLLIGELFGQNAMVMQGRVHFYEGYSMGQVTFPIRVMQRLGVQVIILTNAAGAINPNFEAGDVMLLTDQINMIGMGGMNPLRGPNLEEFGERFPDMSHPYDPELLKLAEEAAQEKHIGYQKGVYICLAGPSFESPADLRFLRAIGADAVGMSTVPETIVARHGRTRVLGISGISNKANLNGSTETTHEEVLAAGEMIVPKLSGIIQGVMEKLNLVSDR